MPSQKGHNTADDGSILAFASALEIPFVLRIVSLAELLAYRADLATGDALWSAPLLRKWGYDDANVEMKVSWWLERTHPDDIGIVTQFLTDALAGKFNRWTLNYRFRRADGTWADVEGLAELVRDASGRPVATEGVVRDVSELRVRERELRANEERFRFLTEHSRELVCRHGADGLYTYVSPSIHELAGWTPQDLLGRDAYDFMHPDDHERVRQEARALALRRELDHVGLTYRFRRADGAYVWFETLARPVLGPDGSTAGWVSTSRDVTDRQQQDAERLQAQKMELLTRVAAGIAHDFNNRLAVMQANAELLHESLTDAEARTQVAEILLAATESATLMRQILTFTKQEFVQPEVVDLGALCGTLRGLIERVVGGSTTIDLAVEPGAWTRGDAAHVEQILLNLVLNARDAMPQGGHIVVRVDSLTLPEAFVHARGEVPAGTYRRLRIADEGTGMTPEVLARAAEPFFTMRPDGVGSGLGLTTVARILAAWQGHLVLSSAPGRGTTVDCLLPAVDAPAPTLVRDQPTLRQARGRVLLVEDEPIVRLVARRLLTKAGYTVIEAEDGISAMRLLETSPHPDLVLTDVVMPRMTGRELGDAIAARDWDIPILYMSGYSPDELLRQGLLDRARTVVGKPFSIETLLGAVHSALRAS